MVGGQGLTFAAGVRDPREPGRGRAGGGPGGKWETGRQASAAGLCRCDRVLPGAVVAVR